MPFTGVDHAGFDAKLEILVIVLAWRVKNQFRLTRGVCFDRFMFDDRALTGVVVVTPVEIVVVPVVLMIWEPVVIKRILVNKHFDGRVTDWATEVIVGLDLYLDFFTESKRLLLSVLFRSFYFDLELRQLVFFEPKQFCSANVLRTALIPELNVVLAERKLLAQLKRSPRTAKHI